jgi:hypothetical protein
VGKLDVNDGQLKAKNIAHFMAKNKEGLSSHDPLRACPQ